MRGSRGRLSGTSVFLSGAFLVVWAAGAVARVPLEGGAWSFSGVIRIKDCGTSISFPGGRRTVTRGCFPAVLPLREKRTLDVRPGELPTLGLLVPGKGCDLERGLVRYVASRKHPRRFVLAINDREAVTQLFASCSVVPGQGVSGYRLDRLSSTITVSADGRRVRQRDVLWDALRFDDRKGWARERSSFTVRGRRTGDVATTAAVGQDTGDTGN
jgi:hypothetical protein